MADNILQLKIIVDGKEGVAMLDKAQLGLDRLREKTYSTGGAAKSTSGDLKGMQMAVGQLGWAMGDANMFLVNFRMGLMSIGNNIPMVIQYMGQAKTEAAALGLTFRQSLLQSLMGPSGLLLGISLLMTALQVLPVLFSKNKEEAKGFAKAVESSLSMMLKVQSAFEDITFTITSKNIGNIITATDSAIKELEDKTKVILQPLNAPGMQGVNFLSYMINMLPDWIKGNKDLTEQEQQRLDVLIKQAEYLKEQKANLEAQRVVAEELDKMGLTGKNEKAEKAGMAKAKKDEAARLKEVQDSLERLSSANESHIARMEAAGVRESKVFNQRIQYLIEEIALRKKLNVEYTAQLESLTLLTSQGIKSLSEEMTPKTGTGKIQKQGLVNGNVNEGLRLEATTGAKPLFSETSRELQAQLILLDAWESAASSATDALASGLTENIQLFGRADNALSNFANKFIQILLQKAILGFVNMMTGGFGSLLGGLFGAPVSGGGGGLGTLNSGGALSSAATRLVRIELHAETKLKGGDIYQAWKGERNYREKYT